MKNRFKFIYSLLFLTIVVYLFSCGDEEIVTNPFTDNNYVFFNSSNASLAETPLNVRSATGTVLNAKNNSAITVSRFSKDISQPITVTVNFTAVYTAADNDFVSPGEDASDRISFSSVSDLTDNSFTVTIPSSEYNATFYMYISDDLISSGDVDVSMGIASVSSNDYMIGKPDVSLERQDSLVLTINDDDCPLDIASFEGTYIMKSVIGTGNSCCPNLELCGSNINCAGDATITADPTDPSATTAIITHPAIGGSWTIKFLTCTKEISVVTPMTSFGGVGVWRMQQGAVLGSYNEETNALVVTGVLGSNGSFSVIFEKK